MIIRRFDFSSNEQITAQIYDDITNHLWTAFAKNSNNICLLKKQAGLNPVQNYYTLNRYVENINALDIDTSNIYVAYDDTTLIGEIISKSNPLTSIIEISKGTFVESPIDIKVDGTILWILMPGDISGTNAQLIRYNTSGIFQETIDLPTIVNAKSMVVDSNGDVWIVTYTDPAKIIRVFEISGGTYDVSITNFV